MSERILRTAKSDLRLSPAAKEKLRASAQAAGCSVSEFVLGSALVRAEETPADRSRFGLDPRQRERFLEALDAPTRDLSRLDRLFDRPRVFEAGPTS